LWWSFAATGLADHFPNCWPMDRIEKRSHQEVTGKSGKTAINGAGVRSLTFCCRAVNFVHYQTADGLRFAKLQDL
jgi:hypothetical protein